MLIHWLLEVLSSICPMFMQWVSDHGWCYKFDLFQTYLKEILKEICMYNMRAPHKNMWELKPEFRHYKDKEGEASTSVT